MCRFFLSFIVFLHYQARVLSLLIPLFLPSHCILGSGSYWDCVYHYLPAGTEKKPRDGKALKKVGKSWKILESSKVKSKLRMRIGANPSTTCETDNAAASWQNI